MRYRAICKNKEFTRVYARGKSYVSAPVVLYVLKNRLGYTRVGLTATKKLGGAVERNRARRVMRAAMYGCLPYNVGGYDLVLVARAPAVQIGSDKMLKSLKKLLLQSGLIQSAEEPLKKESDESAAEDIHGPHTVL